MEIRNTPQSVTLHQILHQETTGPINDHKKSHLRKAENESPDPSPSQTQQD